MFLFFVRGGDIYPNNTNKFYDAGQYGSYWSSRAYSDARYAYRFRFNDSGVDPSDWYHRYLGFSLRCLIPTP